ncbi:MAG: hypothetical protein ABGZ23_09530 [Fuerstiella sp.]
MTFFYGRFGETRLLDPHLKASDEFAVRRDQQGCKAVFPSNTVAEMK